MRLENKKIIAREFLYTLTSIILIGIIAIVVVLYQNSIDNVRNEISDMELKDTINYRLNIYNVTKRIKDNDTNNKYINEISSFIKLDSRKEFIKSLKSEKISSKYFDITNETFEIGINKNQFLKRIIKDNNFSEKKLKKLELLETKLIEKNKSIFSNDDFIVGATIFIFLLFFPIRYLIYATSWSIKQIKSQ